MKTENIYLKIRNKQALVSVSFKGPNLFILYIYIYIYLQRTISCKNTHTPTVQKGRGYKWTVDTEFMVITFISKHLYQERERELGGPNRNSTTLPWKLKSWNTCSLSWLSVPTDKVRIFFGGGGPRQDKVRIKRIINDSTCGTWIYKSSHKDTVSLEEKVLDSKSFEPLSFFLGNANSLNVTW